MYEFVQKNKGTADHSQMQIAEGKTYTKKLVSRVHFQLHICTKIPLVLSPCRYSMSHSRACMCVCVRVRACLLACVRACVRVC